MHRGCSLQPYENETSQHLTPLMLFFRENAEKKSALGRYNLLPLSLHFPHFIFSCVHPKSFLCGDIANLVSSRKSFPCLIHGPLLCYFSCIILFPCFDRLCSDHFPTHGVEQRCEYKFLNFSSLLNLVNKCLLRICSFFMFHYN